LDVTDPTSDLPGRTLDAPDPTLDVLNQTSDVTDQTLDVPDQTSDAPDQTLELARFPWNFQFSLERFVERLEKSTPGLSNSLKNRVGLKEVCLERPLPDTWRSLVKQNSVTLVDQNVFCRIGGPSYYKSVART
jgi:hypothetical protein